MKISILISAFNRAHTIPRCLDSIYKYQDYEDIEVVLVNDGSADNTDDVIKEYPQVKYIKHPVRTERVISYNEALQTSTGDYIFHMGSDDTVFPRFLGKLKFNLELFPDYKVYNYGWLTVAKGHMSQHPGLEFKPEGEGTVHFNSGCVAAGSFCWHKSVSHQIEFPDVKDCYAFADESGIPGYSRFTKTLGNPWGEDYYIFWKLTRKNISKHLRLYGVIVNIRGS